MNVYIVEAALWENHERFEIVYASIDRAKAFEKMTELATLRFGELPELVNGNTCYAFPGGGCGDIVAFVLKPVELDSQQYALEFLRYVENIKPYEALKAE